MSQPRDPKNNCFVQKNHLPLTERIQFRGTEEHLLKIENLATMYDVDTSEVLRTIVSHYQPKAEHFRKARRA